MTGAKREGLYWHRLKLGKRKYSGLFLKVAGTRNHLQKKKIIAYINKCSKDQDFVSK